MTPKLFTELGLSPESLKAVERLGFEQASPIQAEAIPHILSGKDVVGQSQTGSGKTAAFGLPAIEKINPKVRGVQVLVLCPTRELAVQVSEEIHKLAHFNRAIKPLPIFGGASYERQYAGLHAGANIVIGTPGRVQDHLERGSLKLDQVKIVILDEADEMLDMGFREDIEKILLHAPKERQTVLFSATIPHPIEELIRRYTKDPVRVQIAAKALTVPTVDQIYYEVHQQWKFEALTRLVDLHDVKLGIVFCNTQRTVDELTEHLHAAGYDADALHGGLAQQARDRVMKKFKTGVLTLLIATDVAGRGIDVNDIEVVFNYDLPYDPEDYVHRIGRTGRAGRSGKAITLVSGREFFRIRHLERFTRQRILRGQIPSEDQLAEAKERKLLDDVRTVIQHGNLSQREHMIQALMNEGFDSVQVAGALLHLLAGGEVPNVDGEAPERSSLWEESGTRKPAAQPSVALPVTAVPLPPPTPHNNRAAETGAAIEAQATIEPVGPGISGEAVPAAAPEPMDPKVEKAPKRKPRKPAVDPVAASGTEAAAETTIPPAVQPLVEPMPTKSSAAPIQVEEEVGFTDGESPVASPAPAVLTEPEPARKPTRPDPAKAAPDEPPKLRSSTWDRPKFAPRFDRTEPAETPAAPRPPRPAASRFDRAPDRLPVPRDYDRPERPPEREGRFDRGQDRPPNRFSETRAGYGASGGESRPMRYTARPDDAMTQVWISMGEADGITTRDIVGCILGETGLPKNVVGQVNIAERHTLVSIPRQEARNILSALNQAQLRGRRIRAKLSEF
jgi:ATP-dependent RNA helicase DeaD